MRDHNRKPLRQSGHDYSAAGCYFVTVCTKRRMCLLGEVGADVLIGPCIKLTEIGKAVDRVLSQMPTVENYVVMPNHIHVLFHLLPPEERMAQLSGEGPMGTSAPTQSVPYLVRYIKRAGTQVCGESMWQRSYHDRIIRTETERRRAWEYIDSNPAKWTEDQYYTVPGLRES